MWQFTNNGCYAKSHTKSKYSSSASQSKFFSSKTVNVQPFVAIGRGGAAVGATKSLPSYAELLDSITSGLTEKVGTCEKIFRFSFGTDK